MDLFQDYYAKKLPTLRWDFGTFFGAHRLNEYAFLKKTGNEYTMIDFWSLYRLNEYAFLKNKWK